MQLLQRPCGTWPSVSAVTIVIEPSTRIASPLHHPVTRVSASSRCFSEPDSVPGDSSSSPSSIKTSEGLVTAVNKDVRGALSDEERFSNFLFLLELRNQGRQHRFRRGNEPLSREAQLRMDDVAVVVLYRLRPNLTARHPSRQQ